MEHTLRQILHLTVLGLLAFSANADIKAGSFPHSRNITSAGDSFGNSSIQFVTPPKEEDPLSEMVNLADSVFKDTLTCPEGIREDVVNCIRTITTPIFDSCAVLNCEGADAGSGSGAGKGDAELFLNVFNEQLKSEGCTSLLVK